MKPSKPGQSRLAAFAGGSLSFALPLATSARGVPRLMRVAHALHCASVSAASAASVSNAYLPYNLSSDVSTSNARSPASASASLEDGAGAAAPWIGLLFFFQSMFRCSSRAVLARKTARKCYPVAPAHRTEAVGGKTRAETSRRSTLGFRPTSPGQVEHPPPHPRLPREQGIALARGAIGHLRLHARPRGVPSLRRGPEAS